MYHIDPDALVAVNCPYKVLSDCHTTPHFKSQRAALAYQARSNGRPLQEVRWSSIPAASRRKAPKARPVTFADDDESMFRPF